jgi:hypothetical protein
MPCRVTWVSTRVGPEQDGVWRKQKPEPLLWFPQQGMASPFWIDWFE